MPKYKNPPLRHIEDLDVRRSLGEALRMILHKRPRNRDRFNDIVIVKICHGYADRWYQYRREILERYAIDIETLRCRKPTRKRRAYHIK